MRRVVKAALSSIPKKESYTYNERKSYDVITHCLDNSGELYRSPGTENTSPPLFPPKRERSPVLIITERIRARSDIFNGLNQPFGMTEPPPSPLNDYCRDSCRYLSLPRHPCFALTAGDILETVVLAETNGCNIDYSLLKHTPSSSRECVLYAVVSINFELLSGLEATLKLLARQHIFFMAR